MKNIIRNTFRNFGLNVTRIQSWDNNYKWLDSYNIKNVIDIGANVGQFANHIHKIIPNAQIHSFEPISAVYEKLLTNTKDIPCTCYPYGLGAETKTANIYANEYSPSSSLLAITEDHKRNFSFAQKSDSVTIDVRPLDSFTELVNLDNLLVKIDVQGYEDQVVIGGTKVLTNADIVFCEVSFKTLYQEQLLFKDLNNLLEKLGFSFMGNLDQVYDKDDGAILYADALFIKM